MGTWLLEFLFFGGIGLILGLLLAGQNVPA